MASFSRARGSSSVTLWLGIMILLVIATILIGAATRLTNAGLSITEWKPVTGVIPPLSVEDWAVEFEKYKQIPEFAAEHPDMDVEGFKFIYFMEWGHRIVGRIVGLAYLIPLVLLSFLGKIPKERRLRFYFIFVLICVQGGIGWFMVKSGFEADRVDVSPYRLATHLSIALIILGMIFWTWRDNAQDWPNAEHSPPYAGRINLLFLLVFLQIIAGAFVAGTHAGYTYNTWPMMDGRFVPDGYLAMKPLWVNAFENVAAIQFNHRLLAYIILGFAVWVWSSVRSRGESNIKSATSWLLFAVLFQAVLGILALLKIVAFPYALAHQAGAIFLFLMALAAVRSVRIRR